LNNVITTKIARDLYLVRTIDRQTKYFEGMWEIPEGVTYNSYVLTTSSGAVVFDTVKPLFTDLYLDAISKITDFKDIKYIVVHHVEPDHSGVVKQLAEKTGSPVLGHPLADKMLKRFYQYTGKFQSISDLYELSTGEYTIGFIHTPWLHWPETMMSYIKELNALLTCDAFGSYGSYAQIYYDELDGNERGRYRWLMLKYFANIIGFYRHWVSKNIEKLISVGIEPAYILPSHGLAARDKSVKEFVNLYLKWSLGEVEESKIIVLYTSMYGFVKKAVNALIEKLQSLGLRVVVYGFNDIERSPISEVVADVYDSKYVVIATSAYDADAFPIAKLLAELLSRKTPLSGKRVIVLAAHGWGPRAGSVIKGILELYGFKELSVIEFAAGEHEKIVESVLKAL